ncbi:serine/threonine protein kinase [Neptunomonas phycophila]|uniref:serine/threonine protein kinase n=1 Tax=Neptunomonas phycophila TaxID=1572645 RepID=UPI001BE97935|nr:serine/threonine protein kinase [Neptunomonas phycophila]MBT3145617.1 serine/threonine protein kinase [Neptunomonas phycophila]MDO6784423.1 serine/threonine protein kinase [Neptunomonas phycophila]
MSDSKQPFYELKPDTVIDAVESIGYLSDGRIMALNSYENRVYQVGIDESEPLIAKFYRPQRWTDEQIGEEHRFMAQLVEQDLSVVAPIKSDTGQTLFSYDDYRFSIFVRKGGRAPELEDPEHLFQLGNTLGRIHLAGQAEPFKHRPTLDIQSYGIDSTDFISRELIPASLKAAYDSLTSDLLREIDAAFKRAGDVVYQRVHGDCHGGNILWRDDMPHFVDFDDARMAPAIQDLWMLLTGDRHQQELQLGEVIDGYNEFASFNPRELHLVEALRTLRMMNYAAWIGRRWEDPAFPMSFPWFNTERYWGEHLLELKEQFAKLQEPVLKLL